MFGDEALRRDFADVLGRVDGIVLFAPVDVALEKAVPTFVLLRDLPGWQVGLGRIGGYLRETVADAVMDGVHDPKRALREEADRTIEILNDGPRRRASQRMMALNCPFNEEDRPDWKAAEAIEAGYAKVNVPCLILWGEHDELFGVSMGYKLVQQIPQARLRIVPESMHSLPTERPGACAKLVQDFVKEPKAGGAMIGRVDAETGEEIGPRRVPTTAGR